MAWEWGHVQLMFIFGSNIYVIVQNLILKHRICVLVNTDVCLLSFSDNSAHSGADSGGGRLHTLRSQLLRWECVPDAVVSALPGDLHPCAGRHLLHRAVVPRRAVAHTQTPGRVSLGAFSIHSVKLLHPFFSY